LEIIADNGLTEISGGVIEGMKFTDIFKHYPELEYMWCNEFHNFAPENGEAIRDTYERIWTAVKKIVRDNDGKTIVLASHGGTLRTLICRLTVGALENINSVPFSDNTAVSKIVFTDTEHWVCEYINDASHVPAEFMPKKNKITTNIKKAD
ncbi:MAG: histidine phosphatase family protein, partial [Clostridia bacterium]|nr:histidine phosphatase family protein [Clostridia bacterium]